MSFNVPRQEGTRTAAACYAREVKEAITSAVAEIALRKVDARSTAEVKAEFVSANEPQTLTLKVPTLSAGRYRLEVRNTRHDSKTLRIGLFTPVLTVG